MFLKLLENWFCLIDILKFILQTLWQFYKICLMKPVVMTTIVLRTVECWWNFWHDLNYAWVSKIVIYFEMNLVLMKCPCNTGIVVKWIVVICWTWVREGFKKERKGMDLSIWAGWLGSAEGKIQPKKNCFLKNTKMIRMV